MYKPARGPRYGGEAENRIYGKWQGAMAPLDEFAVKQLDGVIKTAKWAAADRITASAAAGGRLSSFDEGLFDAYSRLMDFYEDFALLYHDRQKITPPAAGNIWDGVYAVLVSRIKLYTEDGAKRENPIAIEKKDIIAKAVKLFFDIFDSMAARYKLENQRQLLAMARKELLLSMDYQNGIKVYNAIQEAVAQEFYKKIYGCCQECVNTAHLWLNNMDGRVSLRYYRELLNEEFEILSSIIKIQAGALEEELRKGEIPQGERHCLTRGLDILREAYQSLIGDLTRIETRFKDEEKTPYAAQPAFETWEAYSHAILSAQDKFQSFSASTFQECCREFEEKNRLYREALYRELRDAVKSVRPKEYQKSFEYQLMKDIYELEHLTESVSRCFKSIWDSYSLFREDLDATESAHIIRGVAETVDIKRESLKDSLEAFVEEAKAMAEPPVKDEEDFQLSPEAIARYLDQCALSLEKILTPISRNDRKALGMIRQWINECRTVYEEQCLNGEKNRKRYEKNIQNLNKKVFKFRRDSLLFEISTFEEIMYYSVSRLRESENGTVSHFVAHIDKETFLLEHILEKHGIELIKPVPHDMFNGKEHEVLLAESHEDFKKGEIIKLMNSGYKQNGIVIIRANVIAAK